MVQDFRYAIRTLLRSPGFTATAAITLALGIGANTVMFSVVNAVLLRPLPFADPDRLVLISSLNVHKNVGQVRATALDFADWRAQARSFESMAGYVGTGFTFSDAGEPEMVVGQLVTTDFFRVLGVQPIIGHDFTDQEFTAGREQAIVLSYGVWQRRFASDHTVIGRTTTVNGKPYTIVGVMSREFEFPAPRYQVWTPLPMTPTSDGPPVNRGSHYLQVAGRLRRGVAVTQAQAEMTAIAAALAAQYPDTNQDLGARLASLAAETVKGVSTALRLLFAAVGFVVLIACANVTNLLLARATGRQREVAIRCALGAGRLRVIRHFLAESLVLYAIGAAGALGVAVWGVALLVSINPGNIPRLGEASLDTPVLLVTLVVSLCTALVFGLVPAVQAARSNVAEAMKSGGRTVGAAQGRQRLRAALVVGELALASILLVGAGLAVRSFVNLMDVDPGFDPDGQLTFSIVMQPARYPDAARIIAFESRLLDQIAALPGVEHVGATTHLPFSGQNIENRFSVDGMPESRERDMPVAGMHGIAADYFRALGIRLKAGRLFTGADRADSPPVAIVNEKFATLFWPGVDAVGKRLKEGGPDSTAPWRTVVGIIGDIRHAGPVADARPEVAIPYDQLDPDFILKWTRGLTIVVRTPLPLSNIVPDVRRTVHAADSLMPLNEVQTMAAWASDATAQPRFRTLLLGVFAGLALVLAMVGIFGALSYFVAQRTQEIGVRIALGAQPSDVMRMVVGRGVVLAATGVAIGLICAIPLTRYMETLVFGVSPTDAGTFLGVAAGLIAVAAVASYLPARRAMRIDPVAAMQVSE